MSDYINKDDFAKNITERYCSGCNDHFGFKCRACWVDDMLGEIDGAPTVDAEPVRHGHLIMHDDEVLGLTAECSECHIRGMLYGNFCVNCGADMRKENA